MMNVFSKTERCVALTVLFLLFGTPLATAIPHGEFEVTWIAVCHDSSGSPLDSGDIQIRIYEAATDSEILYSSGPDFDSAIQDGVAELCLGCVTDMTLDLKYKHYLEVDINGEEIIGDAAGGRLEFYTGAGDHSRPQLEGRLFQLEQILIVDSAAADDTDRREERPRSSLSQAGEQLGFGLLGQGTATGAGANYSTDGNLLWQPTGEFHSTNYILYLGPYYLSLLGSGVEGCCGIYTGGITGNANCSGDGKLTLSDISRLIDRVYISKELLCCEASGNTNASTDCKITLSDITALIDAVYISKADPEPCLPACEI